MWDEAGPPFCGGDDRDEAGGGLEDLAGLDPQQARIDPRSVGVPGPRAAALPQGQVKR
jgi:hypothetical protein